MTTERRLNLIKTDFEQHEKRTFPRFPFCYLTFKLEGSQHACEIRDISHTGMQLGVGPKNEALMEGEMIRGAINWHGQQLTVLGKVMWSTQGRVGIEFLKRQEQFQQLMDFLSEEKMISALKPLHQFDYGAELPAKLKYWLRSDGPVEIFVWQHQDGELAQFQILLLEHFVEWQDGQGLKTGRIMSKRNVDTPLLDEDEFIFRIDEGVDDNKLHRIRSLVQKLPPNLLNQGAKEFLMMKLS
jgi:hypothetical protein